MNAPSERSLRQGLIEIRKDVKPRKLSHNVSSSNIKNRKKKIVITAKS